MTDIEAMLARWSVFIQQAVDSVAGTPSTPADNADMIRILQEQLATMTQRVESLCEMQPQLTALTTRVKVLEAILTQWPPLVTRDADAVPTGADTAADSAADTAPMPADTARRRSPGRPPSPERQRILALLATHPDGLTAEQIRAAMPGTRPLGDVLLGLRRTGIVRTEGRGRHMRHVVVQP
jgi:hypothetical protein